MMSAFVVGLVVGGGDSIRVGILRTRRSGGTLSGVYVHIHVRRRRRLNKSRKSRWDFRRRHRVSTERVVSFLSSRSCVTFERFPSEEKLLDFAALSSKFVNRKVWMFFILAGTPARVLLYGINMMIQKRYLVVVAGKKRECEVMYRKPSLKCSITRRRTRLRVFRRLRVASSPDGLWLIFSPLLARLRCFVAGA